jgi:hypothetical protein
MIQYTWTTNRLYTLNLPNESNYVVTAEYSVVATESSTTPPTEASFTFLCATFSVIEDNPNYIPYDELTNDIIIGWIQNQMGANGVTSIEQALAGQIETQLNPPPIPQPTPLPF